MVDYAALNRRMLRISGPSNNRYSPTASVELQGLFTAWGIMPPIGEGFRKENRFLPQAALGQATLMAPGSTEKSLTSDKPRPLSLLVRQFPGVTPNYADILRRCFTDAISAPVSRTARFSRNVQLFTRTRFQVILWAYRRRGVCVQENYA